MLGWFATTLTTAVVLIACWYSASGDLTFDEQRTALNLAIAAVVLAVLAGALMLIGGRRAIAARRRRLLDQVPDVLTHRAEARRAEEPDTATTVLVGGAGLTRYHRSHCQMASGRNWPEASRATHEQEGRKPCGACLS
jgi:ABC-type nickel/cobalt efflux system permease component RcnA